MQNGPAGLMFEWESRGYQFFYDSATDLFYEIGNPVLAYIGGYIPRPSNGRREECTDRSRSTKARTSGRFIREKT